MDESCRWYGVENKAGERNPWSEKLLRVAPLAIREIKSRPGWIQGKSRRITRKALKEHEGHEPLCQYYYSSFKTTIPSAVKISVDESRWNESKRKKLPNIVTEKNYRFSNKEEFCNKNEEAPAFRDILQSWWITCYRRDKSVLIQQVEI